MEASELVSLADDPGLAFLNSKAAPNKVTMELIGDGSSYLDWLRRAGLIDEADAGVISSRFTPAQLDLAAAEAAELREILRPAVEDWARTPEGKLAPPVVDRINAILALDARYSLIRHHRDTNQVSVSERHHWLAVEELLVPPVGAIANLLATAERGLVRRCESPTCTLLFYDRTKSHRRRWCSMAVCGNREKARNHRQRGRKETPAAG